MGGFPQCSRSQQRPTAFKFHPCSRRAGPSRVRHFSEHPGTSQTNVQAAATEMAFEEPIDEKEV